MGIATRIAVRLTPDPPVVRTLLLDFTSIEDAAATVSGIIAAGIVPAALEMMDAEITQRGRGLRRRGLSTRRRRGAAGRGRRARGQRRRRPGRCGVACRARARRANGAGRRRRGRACAAVEGPQVGVRCHRPHRTRLLPARHGGAPARSWSTCSGRCTPSPPSSGSPMMNVFHAGDGNLHPLIVFDAASRACGSACTAPATRSWPRASRPGECCRGARHRAREARGDAAHLRGRRPRRAGSSPHDAFDPSAPRIRRRSSREGVAAASCSVFPKARGVAWRCSGGVAGWPGRRNGIDPCDGRSHHGRRVARDRRRRHHDRSGRRPDALGGRGSAPSGPDVVHVTAPDGIITYDPADLTVTVGAGTTCAELADVLRAAGQECALDPRDGDATIGGVLATGLSGHRRLRLGPLRDRVLEVRFVSAAGRLVKAGGPTVKNVSGFDLPRSPVGTGWAPSACSCRSPCAANHDRRARSGPRPAPIRSVRRAVLAVRASHGTAPRRMSSSKGSPPTSLPSATGSPADRTPAWPPTTGPRVRTGRGSGAPVGAERARPRPGCGRRALVGGGRGGHGARRRRRRAGLVRRRGGGDLRGRLDAARGGRARSTGFGIVPPWRGGRAPARLASPSPHREVLARSAPAIRHR